MQVYVARRYNTLPWIEQGQDAIIDAILVVPLTDIADMEKLVEGVVNDDNIIDI